MTHIQTFRVSFSDVNIQQIVISNKDVKNDTYALKKLTEQQRLFKTQKRKKLRRHKKNILKKIHSALKGGKL